ncbi:hypothetical protein V1478_010166 [Vespula squamosa]|uniref:Uncharacterized protein n=1 Tax=Vespula squamosa TaxID=30214 RepID=A0ABD2ALM9_VESSQ
MHLTIDNTRYMNKSINHNNTCLPSTINIKLTDVEQIRIIDMTKTSSILSRLIFHLLITQISFHTDIN